MEIRESYIHCAYCAKLIPVEKQGNIITKILKKGVSYVEITDKNSRNRKILVCDISCRGAYYIENGRVKDYEERKKAALGELRKERGLEERSESN